ncbi:MAG: hypothetical protein ACRD6X_00610 [Pyrinomonadaceae bacterium]
MKAEWKTCQRGDVGGQWAALYVTMNPRGFIVMNRKTYEKMSEPQAMNLLFDPVNNRIGLKPTVPTMRDAFPVAKQGRHGGRLIRAFRLMQEYGIDIKETIRFHDAEIDDDGILILDLRTARISSRSVGQKKK